MRRLQFKFPSQIRISGWDFGSSARAMNQAGGKDSLMTYENESIPQAEGAKYVPLTFERKSMSTKTTIKRIALVAVSAMGLGLLSVVPSSATTGTAQEETVSSLSVGTALPARVGVATTTTITAKYGEALDENDTLTVAARVLTAPAGSASRGLTTSDNTAGAILSFAAKTSGYTESESAEAFTVVTEGGVKHTAATATYETTAAGDTANTTSLGVYLSFTPDVAGTYTILVSSGDTTYQAGNKSAVWTITTVGEPASVTLSSPNATLPYSATTGAMIKVTLKDASGNVTTLGPTESLAITSSSTATTQSKSSLAYADFALGFAYFYSEETGNNAAATEIITVTGSGTLSASVNSNITITYKTPAGTATAINLGDGTTPSTTAATTAAGYAFTDANTYGISTSTGSATFMVASDSITTATQYYLVTVVDTDGVITGVENAVLNLAATQAATTTAAADSYAEVTITAALADGDSYTISANLTSDTITMTADTPALDAWTVETADQRAAVGAKITVKAIAYDQFGVEIANAPVSVSVSGRNTVAAASYVSDSSGYVTFSYTDAGTASTAAVTDTVTFDMAGSSSGDDTSTITFGTYTVGTVTVTGGATADTVAYPAAGATTQAITTAKGGAAGATTTFTATVKDASGNLLSGVPVTWTVDKATAGISKTATVDSSTCITASTGACTTTVFSWAAPSKVTVTATAGGKSGTGHQNFVNASSDARVLSGTSNGNVVIAKVVDRYGNAVAGVRVDAKTSSGYFGSGANSTYGSTDENGEIGFAVTGGNATVTLKVDSATYTQTDDAAGYVGTSAVTAAVAGTTTGVGASLAPAGVNSVTVETTAATSTSDAIDAANEATDAANAATDAANAAAEAADAATAAAQDAQAAVAELATKVASLIAGIKAQITTLTNLVIKIQKKVKA